MFGSMLWCPNIEFDDTPEEPEITERLPDRAEPLDDGEETFPIDPSSDDVDPDSSSDDEVLKPRPRS